MKRRSDKEIKAKLNELIALKSAEPATTGAIIALSWVLDPDYAEKLNATIEEMCQRIRALFEEMRY